MFDHYPRIISSSYLETLFKRLILQHVNTTNQTQTITKKEKKKEQMENQLTKEKTKEKVKTNNQSKDYIPLHKYEI